MIIIIDYGLGNIQAFLNIYKRLHIPIKVAKTAADLMGASKLILPGEGAFDYAMKSFNASGMRDEVEMLVIQNKIPIIGICVGMQMLANRSDEGAELGLGWIPGKVTGFKGKLNQRNYPLPHMGWNDVIFTGDSNFLCQPNTEGEGAQFYFLHSFYFYPEDERHCIARATYGFDFCCAVKNENVYGVQFHPEKSHRLGMSLLKSFAEL